MVTLQRTRRRIAAVAAAFAFAATPGPGARAEDGPSAKPAGPVPANPGPALNPLDRLIALAAGASPDTQLDVLRGVRAALQETRSAPMPAGWRELEDRLAGSPDAEVRTLVRTLGLTFGSQASQDALVRLVASAGAPEAERRAALDALLAAHKPGLGPTLRQALGDAALRGVALRGLAGYEDPETPPAILAAYPGLAPNERRDALATLASRASFARPLMAAMADGRISKNDLTAEGVRQLRQLKDAEVTRRLSETWGVVQETSPDMKAAVDKYTRIYWAGGSTPGDARKGRVVFNRVCAQCHHLFDTGGAVGPDITGANRGDLEYLLQNILFPNAVIPNEYRAASLELKDGRVVMGIIKSRDGPAYSVQTANERLTLQKADVTKVEQSDISMMPEGLLTNLPDQEVRDLLYYLSRPGQVPLPPGS